MKVPCDYLQGRGGGYETPDFALDARFCPGPAALDADLGDLTRVGVNNCCPDDVAGLDGWLAENDLAARSAQRSRLMLLFNSDGGQPAGRVEVPGLEGVVAGVVALRYVVSTHFDSQSGEG